MAGLHPTRQRVGQHPPEGSQKANLAVEIEAALRHRLPGLDLITHAEAR